MKYDDLVREYPALKDMTADQLAEFCFHRGLAEGQRQILEAWKTHNQHMAEKMRAGAE